MGLIAKVEKKILNDIYYHHVNNEWKKAESYSPHGSSLCCNVKTWGKFSASIARQPCLFNEGVGVSNAMSYLEKGVLVTSYYTV